MRILENKYIPRKVVIHHQGYKHICTKCKSVLIVEDKDTSYDNYYDTKTFMCPCCKDINQIFKRKNIVTWTEEIFK